MIADLHCHSSHSDGELGLEELVDAARLAGVQVLAVTDHDVTHPAAELAELEGGGLTLVSGVEFSACWGKQGVHIVGLNVDADALADAVLSQHRLRQDRAVRIAELLEAQGLPDAMAGASQFSASNYLGRPHFARYMVACGFVKDEKKAFRKYLCSNQINGLGYRWPDLQTIIAWITDAGGDAVLAHPLKYKLSRTKLHALCADFKLAGGRAMEVVSGAQTAASTAMLSKLCAEGQFLASCGSDFHKPGQCWATLGRFPALPSSCRPIWERW
jgi:predicted metal-dependent phosphoesterase TrpH